MLDAVTVSLLIGMVTLIIERMFTVIKRIHKSSCCNSTIEFEDNCHEK